MTLIELLIATAAGLVVIGGAFTMFAGAIHSQPRDSAKVAALQEARTTLDRITRELRQGLEVVSSSPTPSTTQMAIVTYVKAATCGGAAASTAIPCRVQYTCGGTTCSRVVEQPNGGSPGPAVQVASGLTTPNVFNYSPSATDPSYVGVSFSVAGSGQPFVLSDGVAMRNLSEES
jgi:type II secretory pathway pseudopilin PulG